MAIARTLITDPRILLMDEPLSNLDAKLREEMRSFIRELQRRLGITTLFVTHDQTEAIELADQVGVMFDGHIVQFAEPTEIFARPLSPRIADFMGATNLIEGRVAVSEIGQVLLHAAGSRLIVEQPDRTATRYAPDAAVTATIRPEHIDITEPATQGENILPARILQRVYYGGIVGYRLALENLELAVRDRSARSWEVGQKICVRLPRQHLWIFPQQG